MRTEIGLVLAAGFGLAAQPTQATCRADLQAPAEVRFAGADGRGYDSFASATYATDLTVSLVNQSDDPCTLLLSFQAAPGSRDLTNGGGGRLSYDIGQNGQRDNIVDADLVGGVPAHAVRITLPGEARVSRHFSFSIPAGQIQPSGAYGDTILVRLLDGTDLDVIRERSVRLQTRVTQQASIFVADNDFREALRAGAGDHHGKIDFGDLHTDETASIGLTILSNDPYDIRFESDHHGALWQDADGQVSRIPYRASFGGRPLNLAGGPSVLRGYMATGHSGATQPLEIRIGDVGTAHAGRYADRIVVTVLPDA